MRWLWKLTRASLPIVARIPCAGTRHCQSYLGTGGKIGATLHPSLQAQHNLPPLQVTGDGKELSDEFLAAAITRSPLERAKLLRDVCNFPLAEWMKVAICKKILYSLCEDAQSPVDWKVLGAVVKQNGSIELLSKRNSRAPLKYLEHVLQGLANQSDQSGIGSEDVLNILRLVRYIHQLSACAVNGLYRAREVLVRELQWLAVDVATKPQLELIHALGLKVPPQSAISMALVIKCYDNLAILLGSYGVPENERQQQLIARVARATIKLNIYHRAFLSSFAEYLLCLVHSGKVQGVVDAQYFLYLFSYMRYPVTELFDMVEREVQRPDSSFEHTDNVHQYIVFNWAYVGQGLEPPALTMSRMWELLDQAGMGTHPALYSYFWLSLLEQLVHLAPPHLDWLLHTVGTNIDLLTGFGTVAQDIQTLAPGLRTAVHVPGAGYAWVCGIIDPDTGFLAQWPDTLDVSNVSGDATYDRAGIPVAVLFAMYVDQLKNSQKLNGVSERKVSLLKKSGWAVARIQYSGGLSECARACKDAMIKAASTSASKT